MAPNENVTGRPVQLGSDQARVLRRLVWGYMFFLPIVNMYFDAVGWLVLLLGSRMPDLPETGRLKPRTLALAGLFISVARMVLFAGRRGMMGVSDAAMRSMSLLLAAAFLWAVCRPLIRLAQQVHNRPLPAQARMRSIAYAVYAILPAAFAAISIHAPAEGLAIQFAYVLFGTVVTMATVGLLTSGGNLCRAASAVRQGEAAADGDLSG